MWGKGSVNISPIVHEHINTDGQRDGTQNRQTDRQKNKEKDIQTQKQRNTDTEKHRKTESQRVGESEAYPVSGLIQKAQGLCI